MKPVQPDAPQLRVLLRTATAKDAEMAAVVLARSGIETHTCADLPSMVKELEQGAGALLLAEEVLAERGSVQLIKMLTMQPAWSDLPVLVLARQGADSRTVIGAMDLPANVTVLERPMRVASMVSALRSALRARRRQYELRTLLEGLRESDRRKNEFLATLAHELRNPMAPLRTALSILMRPTDQPFSTQPLYEMMDRQVDHLVRLVNDLMEVSRVTRAKIELKPEVLDMNDVIRAAIELSKPLLDSARHRLDFQPATPSPTVKGDAVRLAQVFSNLLNNAAKYTPEGGEIHARVERIGRNVVVHVEDNGIGIPPDMLDSIFEMFVQVPGSTRTAQGGLGIGLTLVKSLVGLHGGNVEAHSGGVDHGTRISVTLPMVNVVRVQQKSSLPDQAAPGGMNENILIVDDNRDAADAMSELLKLLGANTRVAYCGVDALREAAESKPSIAILDIGMPGMDGCELARRLREDPQHEGIALVALTGWGQRADRERIASAGFQRHLLKPVDVVELTNTLQQIAASAAE